MKDKNLSNFTYYPLVEDSDVVKINLFSCLGLYIIFASLLFNFDFLFMFFVSMIIPVTLFVYYEQNCINKNIEKWKRKSSKIPNCLDLDIISHTGVIGGEEFNFDDIKNFKIKYQQSPKMVGFLRMIFSSSFINATLEIELQDGKVISMPFHSKDMIRKLVKQLSPFKFQMSFDMEIYKHCSIQ